MFCKDASWITQKAIFGKSEDFNFENYVLECLNQVCYPELKAADIAICGNCLIFWMRENEDGYFDENGEYDVEYSVSLEINGRIIQENDLVELCPNFEY